VRITSTSYLYTTTNTYRYGSRHRWMVVSSDLLKGMPISTLLCLARPGSSLFDQAVLRCLVMDRRAKLLAPVVSLKATLYLFEEHVTGLTVQ
jgi:hypothetical protein